MNRLLFDTNALILAFAGHEPVASLLRKAVQENRLILSSLVVAEFLVQSTPEEERELLALVSISPVLPVDLQAARLGATYRREYLKNKQKEALVDCLIAAQAKQTRAQLVTLDAKNYFNPEISLYEF